MKKYIAALLFLLAGGIVFLFFSVLEKLRSLPLSAGDRLESEKYFDLLTVYRTKGNLCAEEARSLNDILASLLKMLAKYDA